MKDMILRKYSLRERLNEEWEDLCDKRLSLLNSREVKGHAPYSSTRILWANECRIKDEELICDWDDTYTSDRFIVPADILWSDEAVENYNRSRIEIQAQREAEDLKKRTSKEYTEYLKLKEKFGE